MGLIFSGTVRRISPPKDLILRLRDKKGIQTFVETGTYTGMTSSWAAAHFRNVITIEVDPKMYEQSRERWKHLSNISFRLGDSRTVLREIVPQLPGPAIFWLDGHWCTGVLYREKEECPLLGEIDLIKQSSHRHHLLVDDARLYTRPAPKPLDPAQWPTIPQILKRLEPLLDEYYVAITDDVLLAVPETERPVVEDYCRSLKGPKLILGQPDYIKDTGPVASLRKLRKKLGV